jgi:ATP-dependent helicase/nuclease subunit A
MALYREALKRIYPTKRVSCVLIWTDGVRLMPLPDALLDAEIGKITARLVGNPGAPRSQT